MRIKSIIIIFALATFSNIFGQTIDNRENNSHYSFLDISSSSHINGLGGINISTVEDNIMTVDQNPGLLGAEMSNQLGLSYIHYLEDNNFSNIVFSRQVGKSGAWQSSIRYFNYGTIAGFDENGASIGEFSPYNLVLSGGYTRNLSAKLRIGVVAKFIYSGYDSFSAIALASDIGLNYYDSDKDLSLSAVISNIGGQVKRFENEYNKLPADFRLGWSQSFDGLPVRFSVTAVNLTKWHLPYIDSGDGSANDSPKIIDRFGTNLLRHFVFGIDFIPNEKFHIGLGYNYKTRTDISSYSRGTLSGFSIGTGLKIKGFNIDLAYSQPYTKVSVWMLNLILNFQAFIK